MVRESAFIKNISLCAWCSQRRRYLLSITSIKRNFVEAKLLKVNKKSKFRVVPACTIYNECGGCQIMHLHYDKQLEFKTDLLHQALKKFALQDMKTMKFVQLLECRNQSTTVLSYNFRLENLKIRSRQVCMHKTLIIW